MSTVETTPALTAESHADCSLSFIVGQIVMHPLYGIGTVDAIVDRELMGKINKFASIVFQESKLKIMVNLEQKTSLIRPLISREEIPSVLAFIRDFKSELPARSAERYNVNLKKIKSSDIYLLAEVIKDLACLAREKKLTPKETAMLKQSKSMLASEFAFVSSISSEDAATLIDEVIRV